MFEFTVKKAILFRYRKRGGSFQSSSFLPLENEPEIPGDTRRDFYLSFGNGVQLSHGPRFHPQQRKHSKLSQLSVNNKFFNL